MKYSLREVMPKIFLVNFSAKDSFDMCMLFWRYQEFYESPSNKFRNHSFTLVEFMKWYCKFTDDEKFAYMIHWSGFNFPSKIITKVINKGISDPNHYDAEMLKIYQKCEKKVGSDFYLIGAASDKETIHHEIAHGLFYLNSEYRKEMTKLVKNLKPSFRKKMEKSLKGMGYTPQVYVDEMQAFLSTGWGDFELKKEDLPFVDVFEKFVRLGS